MTIRKQQLITFEPILKQTLWGGDKIKALKHLDTALDHIGESWEVSGVEGNVSIVANGDNKGVEINALVAQYKGAFVGEDNYKAFGDVFPLLIKFIDANKDLSIQVHPSDEQAQRRGLKRGKTEMWYIVGTDNGAKLRCGLNKKITPDDYQAMVANDSICDAISEYDVKEGDCFFIPAGRVHSIGKGCFLAEIQETSDVTYRIYDFKRKDKDGNYRQLHTAEAAEVIDYTVVSDYRTPYSSETNQGVQLVSCKHFTTSLYELTEPMTLDYSELDSFVALICTKGGGSVVAKGGETVDFHAGSTVLLPAWVDEVRVEGTVTFLETFL